MDFNYVAEYETRTQRHRVEVSQTGLSKSDFDAAYNHVRTLLAVDFDFELGALKKEASKSLREEADQAYIARTSAAPTAPPGWEGITRAQAETMIDAVLMGFADPETGAQPANDPRLQRFFDCFPE